MMLRICRFSEFNMFAIIENGNRQHRVTTGDVLEIDLVGDAEAGKSIQFDNVLLANAGGASVIGKPYVAGASVTGEVVEPLVKGPKLEVTKFRRRKNVRRHVGHRQKYTSVKVTAINVPGLEVVESKSAAN
jgi:large subunit ribosomal protein L21